MRIIFLLILASCVTVKEEKIDKPVDCVMNFNSKLEEKLLDQKYVPIEGASIVIPKAYLNKVVVLRSQDISLIALNGKFCRKDRKLCQNDHMLDLKQALPTPVVQVIAFESTSNNVKFLKENFSATMRCLSSAGDNKLAKLYKEQGSLL